MKRLLRGAGGLAAIAALTMTACAQTNGRGATKLMLNGKEVAIEYGRPSLRRRTVDQLLAELNPGDVWRVGADRSTTFTAATELAFGNTTVPAGQYSLWVRKEADRSWKLVFNKQHGQWGTDHDAAQDFVAVPLKQEKGAKPVDLVTISLEKEQDSGEIAIQWGQMELTTTFKAK
jgi:hypothetical protein